MDDSVLAVLYRHWIWIGPPLMVAAVVALVVLIQGTTRFARVDFELTWSGGSALWVRPGGACGRPGKDPERGGEAHG
ncbi:MAG: hypothetical protein ABIF09_03905 [Gemmatimonadota bacterium]